MAVTYADGTAGDSFPLTVTGLFGAAPTIAAPADGAIGVNTTPAFSWAAPSGGTAAAGYELQVWPEAGGNIVWDGLVPSSQTQATFDFDGSATSAQLAGFTSYGWQIRAFDAHGNDATYWASFTTGATH
jgi:hypothetical protein